MSKHPKSPCANCPYRKDAPLKLWDKSEFTKLLDAEDDIIGSIYDCHKHIDTPAGERGLCAGWLLDQKKRDIPSIRLRMLLARDDAAVAAFQEVTDGGHELYGTVRQMCRANGVRKTMNEEIDGFRRTSIKTKDRTKMKEKIDGFRDQGFDTRVYESGGYLYLYVSKKKTSGASDAPKEVFL